MTTMTRRVGATTAAAVSLLRPKRRWFRFSLRTMLLVITVFALWLGLHIHATRRQQQSVMAVQDAGGRVQYDYHYPKGRYGRNDVSYTATSRVPQWLLGMLGVDFFHAVVEVDISRDYDYGRKNPDADDDLLRQLSGFPDLRRLELTHCGITDEGLRHLPAFAYLERLELSYSSVSDDGLPYIGRLTSLTSLDLGHTRVTGRGFHRLAELERLEVLILTLTPIRDKALSSVEPLQRLRFVHVHGCRHLTRESVVAFRQAFPTCELRGTASLQRLWKRAADEDTSPTR